MEFKQIFEQITCNLSEFDNISTKYIQQFIDKILNAIINQKITKQLINITKELLAIKYKQNGDLIKYIQFINNKLINSDQTDQNRFYENDIKKNKLKENLNNEHQSSGQEKTNIVFDELKTIETSNNILDDQIKGSKQESKYQKDDDIEIKIQKQTNNCNNVKENLNNEYQSSGQEKTNTVFNVLKTIKTSNNILDDQIKGSKLEFQRNISNKKYQKDDEIEIKIQKQTNNCQHSKNNPRYKDPFHFTNTKFNLENITIDYIKEVELAEKTNLEFIVQHCWNAHTNEGIKKKNVFQTIHPLIKNKSKTFQAISDQPIHTNKIRALEQNYNLFIDENLIKLTNIEFNDALIYLKKKYLIQFVCDINTKKCLDIELPAQTNGY